MRKLFSGLFLLLFAVSASAQTSISALPPAGALAGTEVAPVVQSGQTRKATIAQIVNTAGSTVYQPLDSDLTSIAALTTTTAGRDLLTAADASAIRAKAGTVIGTDVQAYDADLTTFAAITPSANVLTLLGSANYAAFRTSLGVAVGTDVQAYDAELAALAGLTSAADQLPYFTGSGTASLTSFTAAGRSLVDDASATAQRATLDVDGVFAHPGYLSARWYAAHTNATLASGVVLNASRSYYSAFYVPEAITVTDLGARVLTASAGGLFALGVYANDPAINAPTGSVLATVSGLSTTSANTAVSGTLGAPVSLPRGWYWAAFAVDNATATFSILSPTAASWPGVIGDASLSNVAAASASGVTGYQNTTINYASGFTSATGGTFNVVSAGHPALYFKTQ